MRELEGWSYGEIARALGVSVGAVESLISRARRTLRRQREALRGLLLLPFRHGDETGAGLLPKAAVVVAATGLAAAGAGLESQIARPSHHEPAVQHPLPAVFAAVPRPARVEDAPAARASQRTGRRRSAARVRDRVPAAPPVAAPTTPTPTPAATTTVAVRSAAPPAPAEAAPATTVAVATSTAASTAAALTATTPLATATVGTTSAAVTTPSATVPTPAVTVTVPAVTVTVTVPQLPPPSVAQVSGLLGIQ